MPPSLPGSARISRISRISQVSARYLPGTSWSTIVPTHRPHIHPLRHANQIPDRQDPKQGGGGDRPLAAFNESAAPGPSRGAVRAE